MVSQGGDDLDPNYVLSSRVRTGRSIRGFCLPPHCSRGERRAIEKLAVEGTGRADWVPPAPPHPSLGAGPCPLVYRSSEPPPRSYLRAGSGFLEGQAQHPGSAAHWGPARVGPPPRPTARTGFPAGWAGIGRWDALLSREGVEGMGTDPPLPRPLPLVLLSAPLRSPVEPGR